jgi:hypothetical protein
VLPSQCGWGVRTEDAVSVDDAFVGTCGVNKGRGRAISGNDETGGANDCDVSQNVAMGCLVQRRQGQSMIEVLDRVVGFDKQKISVHYTA